MCHRVCGFDRIQPVESRQLRCEGRPQQRAGRRSQGAELRFAQGRVRPPWRSGRTTHEIGGGHERIEHARIVALARHPTELLVERKRVLTSQLGWMLDANEPQVSRQRGANVGQLFEALAGVGAVRFGGFDD